MNRLILSDHAAIFWPKMQFCPQLFKTIDETLIILGTTALDRLLRLFRFASYLRNFQGHTLGKSNKETGFLHVCISLWILNLNAENLCSKDLREIVQWCGDVVRLLTAKVTKAGTLRKIDVLSIGNFVCISICCNLTLIAFFRQLNCVNT